MSKKGDASPRARGRRQRHSRSIKGDRRSRTAAARRFREQRGAEAWFATKRSILRFVLVLGVLTALFNVLFYAWLDRTVFFQSYLALNADTCAAVLTWFGESARAAGTQVVSPRYSLEIMHGCDAIQAAAFFVLAMLAFPSAIARLRRVPYMLVGTTTLLLLNLVRVITLYYTGLYYPKAFEVMHVDVWQTLFIFASLMLWLAWARRAAQAKDKSAHVAV